MITEEFKTKASSIKFCPPPSISQFEITGLFNDEQMSKLASKLISDIVPGMLEDYQSQVSKMGSPLVKDLLNKVLKNVSISDILG